MSAKRENKTGIVILAAGNSSRLGEPKQLLEFKNTTLLKNTINEALLVPNSIVIVVTGAVHETIEKEIDPSKIKIVFNPDWELGMSSSIIAGLKEFMVSAPESNTCIFSVCDQPYLTHTVFEELVTAHSKTKKGIIASSYAGTFGIPVLFERKYFNALLELDEQSGAKKIIKNYIEDSSLVPFEKGVIDIDTQEDYQNLIS
ncbi:molybdenum cofactor cytidylyltransferase [Flavobacterium sp. 270]|nr:molybdenum cofactor cytidylyltransferase [Flavobacterium sp. 270]